jgi:hypothetical protein
MPMIDELHSEVDQGKTAVLNYKDGEKNVKISIRQNKQGQYTRTISYPDGPNPFPKPQTIPFDSWRHLLDDLNEFQATSELWQIE